MTDFDIYLMATKTANSTDTIISPVVVEKRRRLVTAGAGRRFSCSLASSRKILGNARCPTSNRCRLVGTANTWERKQSEKRLPLHSRQQGLARSATTKHQGWRSAAPAKLISDERREAHIKRYSIVTVGIPDLQKRGLHICKEV
jgi:hypothetical protein